ncbi:hypothetical protein [Alkalihalobacillus sp. R86527]|uniref:hypothetical protein n=1 Tax=Alkalihalobacillus sp. R86527 TaxID=3093863 RepID=UPI00366D4F67
MSSKKRMGVVASFEEVTDFKEKGSVSNMKRVSLLGKINVFLGLVFLLAGLTLVFLDRATSSIMIAFIALGIALILSSAFLEKE